MPSVKRKLAKRDQIRSKTGNAKRSRTPMKDLDAANARKVTGGMGKKIIPCV